MRTKKITPGDYQEKLPSLDLSKLKLDNGITLDEDSLNIINIAGDCFMTEFPEQYLWHYTSLESLYYIVEKGVRFSDYRFLNDENEVLGQYKFIKSIITDEIENNNFKKNFSNHLKYLIEQNFHTYAENVFVFSLSERKDALTQWQSYANCRDSCCVGFDLTETNIHNSSVLLGKVIYDNSEKFKIIVDGLKRIESVGKLSNKVRESIKKFILICSLLFKDSQWNNEQEVRLVTFNREDISYEYSKGFIRPYWYLKQKTYNDDNMKLFDISEIVLLEKNELRKGTLKGFLSNKGYNAQISESKSGLQLF